jgi:hypothetical protein
MVTVLQWVLQTLSRTGRRGPRSGARARASLAGGSAVPPPNQALSRRGRSIRIASRACAATALRLSARALESRRAAPTNQRPRDLSTASARRRMAPNQQRPARPQERAARRATRLRGLGRRGGRFHFGHAQVLRSRRVGFRGLASTGGERFTARSHDRHLGRVQRDSRGLTQLR